MATVAFAGDKIRVAAAADLQLALPEVAAAYEKAGGKPVELVFGSSGNLFAQIESGAPYDVFLSADTRYPERLASDGMTVPGSKRIYALGELVVLCRAESANDFEQQGLRALLGRDIHKIAIANPRLAPYGQAAVQALEHSGIYQAVKPKLVIGENISEATQFVESGNAEAGLVARALVKNNLPEGLRIWSVPRDFYSPMEQEGVVVKKTSHEAAAEEFLRYLTSKAGSTLLAEHGFRAPSETK